MRDLRALHHFVGDKAAGRRRSRWVRRYSRASPRSRLWTDLEAPPDALAHSSWLCHTAEVRWRWDGGSPEMGRAGVQMTLFIGLYERKFARDLVHVIPA